LGVFTENELEVETIQWAESGSWDFQPAENDHRPTLLFTTVGSITHGSRRFGPLTAFWVESGQHLTIDGEKESELLIVRFPEPSSRITLGLKD
jgi:hypothetical protein